MSEDATLEEFADQNNSNSSDSEDTNENWPIEKLENHIELVSGAHIKSDKVHTDDDGTPYLTGPEDFDGFGFDVTKYTDEPTKFCEPGDTLVTVKGSGCGKSTFSSQRACISRQLKALRPDSSVNALYLYYFTKSKRIFLETVSEGSAIPGLSKSHLTTLDIPVPALGEQRKVATVLSTVDQAIQKTEEIVEQTAETQKGLLHDLLTYGINENGNLRSSPSEDPSLFEEKQGTVVPAAWEVRKLAETGKWVSGKTPKRSESSYWGGSTPWVTAKDMKKMRVSKTEDSITEAATEDGAKIAPSDSVLILVRGMALAHTLPVVRPTRATSFNQDVKTIIPDSRAVSSQAFVTSSTGVRLSSA